MTDEAFFDIFYFVILVIGSITIYTEVKKNFWW